ncbi:MAG: DUF4410 domain-containing protein [Cupriavidus sp.]|jgi:hypothetical protein|uniref:DUF4410 domain-containing protein n=3 Tax=Sphingobium TaxID=165695 RepID=A0A401J678_SPHXE|nr:MULTISPECIES: DUF4410 domain-containing protein [Sphingobium]MBU64724.1 DUF4410 domain-containing protein [Cupriavidus sp.]RSU72999.1 DUF4410 domain-containing protein [Sphingomonas sp. S-NIH.Pt3_0716]ATP18002.1 DUF4410 domain-containing protein [Sphingobium yanoikuyae]AYO75809.1 DUF4410 domain-containing protein [Sphingobium yanoikuyae]KMW29125.1 hypothetical protein BV87_15775 [Sphingobium yanoikuyae]|tara:strand:+ start:8352 stop:9086 length:735 start_codon:yes stop_codon:yes gene_type:complete
MTMAERGRMCAAAIPLVGALLLLPACAGTAVHDLSMAPARSQQIPGAIGVRVTLAPDIRSDPDAGKAAHRLQAELVKAYRKAGLPASVTPDGQPSPGEATVRVQIVRADPGNSTERLLIGFGAGRSALLTKASFDIAGQAGPAMSFSATAKDGRKPGLIVPGAVAAATGELSRLAIGGGVSLLVGRRSGLDGGAKRSAALIVKQTRQLYRASGWPWPSDKGCPSPSCQQGSRNEDASPHPAAAS